MFNNIKKTKIILQDIKKQKKIIHWDLKKIIKSYNFVKDIWVYGNFEDRVSDLDLIVIYKKKLSKIYFPKYIQSLIDDGSVIFLENKSKYDVFLFENLKIYSILNQKKIKFKLSDQYKKYRSLTSFLERYYYSRLFLKEKKIIVKNKINLRYIKSIFFSYQTFFQITNDSLLRKELSILKKKYSYLRAKFNLSKLSNREFLDFKILLKNFDNKFIIFSYNYFEKNFQKIRVKNHKIKFAKNIVFNYSSSQKNKLSKNVFKIPKFFFLIYYFYANQKTTLSKKIMKSFDRKIFFHDKNILNIFDKKFTKYLLSKINFLNTNYLNLKKANFNSGLYRFSWYLKN